VDTVRSTGGNNIERLLIVAGADVNLEMTCSPKYKMPVDISNKLAVSIHYYSPYDFVYDFYYEPYNWTDYEGYVYIYEPKLIWGNSREYHQMFTHFELLKSYFVDKGIPIIISEVGVYTEERKKIESIREYLYMLFSLSSDYDGIMCCLWDTSNKIFGNMNFYDRTNDIWYDEKIKNNFLQISRGKNIKPKDYYIYTTFESTDVYYYSGGYAINFGKRKVLKIIINIRYTGILFVDCNFGIYTTNNNGQVIKISFGKENSKKQYDGTYIFIIDASKIDCNSYVEVGVTKGMKFITLNNLTLEFEESFLSIDYKSLKKAISDYIN